MRRSFDIPIRSQKTSLGMCSEVLPRPDPPPWVGLIIYTVGFYFERKCADLTETSLPYPTETKRECWMARCISYSGVSWKMLIPWLAFFFLHHWKTHTKKIISNFPNMWCALTFFPILLTTQGQLGCGIIVKQQISNHEASNWYQYKLLASKECVNWPVFGWRVLRGSPGPSMGWSARNVRAWSKVLTTKCSRSFSSDRSTWQP